MKITIIKKCVIPSIAKISGDLHCHCNKCKKVTFHYLYNYGEQNFMRCICGESLEIAFILEAKGTA